MIAVFRTNISNAAIADDIVQYLHSVFPGTKVNFDLDDCDNILRMECNDDIEMQVKLKLAFLGYQCEAL